MIPKGWRLLEVATDSIVVGATDFLLMFEDAPKEMIYEGVIYGRGMLECIPSSEVGDLCSVRRYNEVPKRIY